MSVVASCARALDRPPVGTHVGPGWGGERGEGGGGRGVISYLVMGACCHRAVVSGV